MANDQPQIFLSHNLKILLSSLNITQKDLSSATNVTPSTISGYIKGDKLPNIEFLASLKKYLSGISMDDFIFTHLSEEDFSTDSMDEDAHLPSDLFKYFGAYFLYYLDTNRRSNLPESTVQDIDLRYGVLYIYKSLQSEYSANCVAVFGIKRREDAQQLKSITEKESDDSELIISQLKNSFPHSIYYGKLDIASQHIFISLNQKTDKRDQAHIVLHHQDINKDYYSGGLGTINSASTGRYSDPIVQLIALSRNPVYLSDEEIRESLGFSKPQVKVDGSAEATEIIRLAADLYEKSESSRYNLLTTENKQVLMNSYLNELIKNNLEANQLWYGRVSSDADDLWYHTIKASEEHFRSKKENDNVYATSQFF